MSRAAQEGRAVAAAAPVQLSSAAAGSRSGGDSFLPPPARALSSPSVRLALSLHPEVDQHATRQLADLGLAEPIELLDDHALAIDPRELPRRVLDVLDDPLEQLLV